MFRAVLTDRLQAAFAAAGIDLPEGFAPEVALASDTRFGDYQSNAAMILAKRLKTNPRALAQQVVDKLDTADLCEKVAIDGPGFLNFTLSAAALEGRLGRILADDRAGVPAVADRSRILLGRPGDRGRSDAEHGERHEREHQHQAPRAGTAVVGRGMRCGSAVVHDFPPLSSSTETMPRLSSTSGRRSSDASRVPRRR